MESTPGKRLLEWREYKGITLAEMSRITGIRVSTLSSGEQAGSSNPSYDTITKVLAGFPDLNPDWLLLGKEPMLRDGRTLTPAASTEKENPEPQAVQRVLDNYGTTVELAIANARLADRDDTIREQAIEIARLNKELGKPFNGLDAAGPVRPTPPTPIGFRLSVSHRVRAERSR